MTRELSTPHKNNTYLMQLSPQKKTIEYGWIYKIKHKTYRSIERYKARLVVKGQYYGIDY